MATQLIGTTVYDEFGAWALERNADGTWSAVQGGCEVLLLDQRDFDRFGIEANLKQVAA